MNSWTSEKQFSLTELYNDIKTDIKEWGPHTLQTYKDIAKIFHAEQYIFASPHDTPKIFVQLKPQSTWKKGEFLSWLSMLRAYQEHPSFFAAMHYLREMHPKIPLPHAFYLSLSATYGGHIPLGNCILISYFWNGPTEPKNGSNDIMAALSSDSLFTCGSSSWGKNSATTIPRASLNRCWFRSVNSGDAPSKVNSFSYKTYQALCRSYKE